MRSTSIRTSRASTWPAPATRWSGPRRCRERPPELVIAMNAVYVDEIGEQLSALGLGATKVVGV